jgi:glycosyltransferase involved in cell wall biosynthesis
MHTLFIGALDESKRIDFLLDAADEIARAVPNFTLTLVGDGPLRERVEARAQSRPHLLYKGRLVGDALAIEARSKSLLLMPGRVGLVAVEAFALALPVVTTDWPWHAPEMEYVSDGVNGLVTPDSVPAYAAAVVGLLRDKKLIASLAYAALETAKALAMPNMIDNFASGVLGALASVSQSR